MKLFAILLASHSGISPNRNLMYSLNVSGLRAWFSYQLVLYVGMFRPFARCFTRLALYHPASIVIEVPLLWITVVSK